jgi:signal transduction histidine kinase
MTRSLFELLALGWQALREHRELWLVIVAALVLPILFVALVKANIDALIANANSVERSRVSTIHGAVEAFVAREQFRTDELPAYLKALATAHPDLRTLLVLRETAHGYLIIGALDEALIHTQIEGNEQLRLALARPGESFMTQFFMDSVRVWQSARAFSFGGENFYVFSEHALAALDARIDAHLARSYAALAAILLFLGLFTYYLVRQIDYRTRWRRLTAAQREQSLLMGAVVHELRAPLTAIRGHASMLEEKTELPASVRAQANTIAASAARLIGLVGDLLTLSQLESGAKRAKSAPVDVRSLLKQVVAEQAEAARQAGLTLTLEPALAATVFSDEGYLMQIFTNLISNAIKYTPEGGVSISLKQESAAVEIRIKDTGTGMSAEDQAKLFAPFARVGGVEKSGITGSGLGMWITRRLLEELGGAIGVESIKGVGTHVVVRLPNRQRRSAEPPTTDA